MDAWKLGLDGKNHRKDYDKSQSGQNIKHDLDAEVTFFDALEARDDL